MSIRKQELLKTLIDDFKKMFPNASSGEKNLLRMKLQMLEESDLELLVTQVKP